MNDEQYELLAATVEVLGGAVKLLLAERIRNASPAQQEQLISLLQEKLSSPLKHPTAMTDPEAVAVSDLDVRRPEIAKKLMDDVRRLVSPE